MEQQESLHWNIEYLVNEFGKESDRAAVILVTSLIDQTLTDLLKLYLLPSSSDEVFDGINSPLANFSSKINFAHRIGLISAKFNRDLHMIRKIRNQFAHNVFGCDFKDGSVKQRIDLINKSFNDKEYFFNKKEFKEYQKSHKGLFLAITMLMLFELNEKSVEVNPSEEALLETFYADYKENEM